MIWKHQHAQGEPKSELKGLASTKRILTEDGDAQCSLKAMECYCCVSREREQGKERMEILLFMNVLQLITSESTSELVYPIV